jgi:hypothetical protein
MTLLNCSFDKKQTGLFVWGRIPDDIDTANNLLKIFSQSQCIHHPGFIFGAMATDI